MLLGSLVDLFFFKKISYQICYTAYTMELNLLTIINSVVVIIGVPTIIGILIFLGRKLQILDDLENVRKKFSIVESKVDDLWADRIAPARSPRMLNEKGSHIVEKSDIIAILEAKESAILAIISKKQPQTAYDAEREIISTILDFETLFPESIPALKKGAYASGEDIEAVLYAGAIAIRDRFLEKLEIPG
jgi:hypothetical protein